MVRSLAIFLVFTSSCAAPATEEQNNEDKYRNLTTQNPNNNDQPQANPSIPLPDSGNSTPNSPSTNTNPGNESNAPATVASICQKLNSLESQVRCRISSTSECSSYGNQNCLNEMSATLDCFAQNIRGCMCESTGDVNCEGTYKVDEVPEIGAPCAEVTRRYAACEEQFRPADTEAGSYGGYDEMGGYYGGYSAGSYGVPDYGM